MTSPRLSERLRSQREEIRNLIIGDIWIYSGIIVLCLAWDVLFNICIRVGLYQDASAINGHPYSIGTLQAGAILFGLIKLIEKIRHLRRY